MKNKILPSALIGLVTAVLAFALFFTGIRFILEKELVVSSVLIFGLLSLIFGIISAVYWLIRPRAGFYIYCAGLLASFILMFSYFSGNKSAGWGDLAGIAAFFMFAIISIGAAALAQFIIFVSRRNKSRKDAMKAAQVQAASDNEIPPPPPPEITDSTK